ncbi:MAG: ornithine cyclodeaminase family protein [Pseudomonadota bacterium]|nr:ornithine cyclodeaminase family protein [Pseudomonadota bacterium]
MLVLSNDDVERLLNMQDCIEALEPMYRDYARGKALLSPRVDNLAPTRLEGAYYGFKHMGGTWPAKGVQALRLNSDVITHPTIDGKLRRVKQPLANGRWVGLVLLFSTDTGELLAMFPDGVMQRLRVGAANGIAMKYLAREDVRTLALIGSGWQAGAQLMAALAVRPIREVRVYSTGRQNRESFAAEARKRHDVTISAVDSLAECVAEADVIMAATSSLVRVIEPEWLKPGVHASCIKSQEVDGSVFERCDRVVVHTAQQAKQLDNILANTPNVATEHKRGWWHEPGREISSFDDLAKLVSGEVQGRRRADEITCFVNNVGIGLQFAAAGALLLERARQTGLGHDLPAEWFSEDVHP